MNKHKQPIREKVFSSGVEAAIDFVIATLISFSLTSFGGIITALLYGFILIVIAPMLEMERLLLVAMTFFKLGIDALQEGKSSEANIFFMIVAISIVVDEVRRFWQKGYLGLQVRIPDSPFLRNMFFAVSSSIVFTLYSIFEYSRNSGSFFDFSGSILVKSLSTLSSGSALFSTPNGTLLLLITVLVISSGSALGGILGIIFSGERLDWLFMITAIFITFKSFAGAWLGLIMAALMFIPIEIMIKFISIPRTVLEITVWFILYMCVAAGSSTLADAESL